MEKKVKNIRFNDLIITIDYCNLTNKYGTSFYKGIIVDWEKEYNTDVLTFIDLYRVGYFELSSFDPNGPNQLISISSGKDYLNLLWYDKPLIIIKGKININGSWYKINHESL